MSYLAMAADELRHAGILLKKANMKPPSAHGRENQGNYFTDVVYGYRDLAAVRPA